MRTRALLLLIALAASSASADETLDTCILCHGANTNGSVGIHAPKLAGLPRSYILRQLQSFRNGTRGTQATDVSGNEMRTVALALKESDLNRIADFVTRQTPEASTPSIEGDASRGKQLYVACAACHGARGEGNESLNAPVLAAGSDWYFVGQLNNYRNGLRGTASEDTHGATMRAAALALPDEKSVRDVVAYINTLR